MLAIKQEQVLMVCPHCGHQQPEARSAFSTICRHCGHHLRVQEILNPTAKAPDRAFQQKHVTCFECGAGLTVPVSAESTMCKWCSQYVDLHDYRITSAVAKNFKTKGRLVIELKGNVFNSETTASEVIIKGKFHGKLTAERSLTIHTGAEIKGTLAVAHLIIPAECHYHPLQTFTTGSAEISGELVGTLQAAGTVTLRSTARWFGDLSAANLVIEEGAVVVGAVNCRSMTSALLAMD